MKDKTDVLQGTLALMVLKTLDVLSKLEQEGSIACEWGTSENNLKAPFYRLTRSGRKQLQAETAATIFPAPGFLGHRTPQRSAGLQPAPACHFTIAPPAV